MDLLIGFIFENVVAILALGLAGWSLHYARASILSAQTANEIAQEALDFATKPIESITNVDEMKKVLPVWFIERMVNDYWHFGMLLRSGQVLVFTRIIKLSSDAKWLEVEMAENDGEKVTEFFKEGPAKDLPTIYSLPERTTASVSVAQIIACFELANT